MQIDWLESKLLDIATNHPSRTEMCRHLSNMGHRVRYYCGYKYSRKIFANLPIGIIHYLSAPSITKIRGIFFMLKIIPLVIYKVYIEKTDILIFDYYINLFVAPFLLMKKYFNRKTKIVLDVRTLPAVEKTFNRDVRLFHLSLKLAEKVCDGFTFITFSMRDYCNNKIKLDNKKISIWSSGFDEEIFDPDKYIKKQKDYFELFYHGSISIDRGIKNLIEGLHILKKKGYPLVLTLVGILEDEKELRKIIIDKNLENACFILKPVANEKIPQMIKNCDLPVIPFSRFRTFEVSCPLKLIEYLAMGKAIVLTDIEAHRSIVGRNAFAFFARSERSADIVDAIESAYLLKDKLEALGKEARMLAIKNYTWRKQAKNLAVFLESII